MGSAYIYLLIQIPFSFLLCPSLLENVHHWRNSHWIMVPGALLSSASFRHGHCFVIKLLHLSCASLCPLVGPKLLDPLGQHSSCLRQTEQHAMIHHLYYTIPDIIRAFRLGSLSGIPHCFLDFLCSHCLWSHCSHLPSNPISESTHHTHTQSCWLLYYTCKFSNATASMPLPPFSAWKFGQDPKYSCLYTDSLSLANLFF